MDEKSQNLSQFRHRHVTISAVSLDGIRGGRWVTRTPRLGGAYALEEARLAALRTGLGATVRPALRRVERCMRQRLRCTREAPPSPATIGRMAEAEGTLQEQLDEIGVQLGWVRDYL